MTASENCIYFVWAFVNLYKKYTVKPNSFLVINTTISSDNPLLFIKHLLEKNIKTNHDNWW